MASLRLFVAMLLPPLLLITVRVTLGPHFYSIDVSRLHGGSPKDDIALKIPLKSRLTEKVTSVDGGNFRTHSPKKAKDTSNVFRSSREVIEYAMQAHVNSLKQVLGPRRLAFLFDLANIENKGDPAISVGELNLLDDLDIQLMYYCSYSCSQKEIEHAKAMAKSLSPKNTTVFFSGGGNFGGYIDRDLLRAALLDNLKNFPAILFPQSTWFHTPGHLEWTQQKYGSHPDFQIFLRDKTSYNFVKNNFQSNKAHLVPDMAFHIGPVKRFFPPIYDIIWLKRKDHEAVDLQHPHFPIDVKVFISDWYGTWATPKGAHLIENSYLQTYNGLLFLQRGRVLVTERLHGYILAILLDMPIVIIDNNIKKISNYRNTWTHGLEKVLVAIDAEDAVQKALQLLAKYG